MPDWIAAGSGAWGDSANWSGGVPNAAGSLAAITTSAADFSTTFLNIGAAETFRIGTFNATMTSGRNITISGLFAASSTAMLIFDSGGAGAAQVNVDNSSTTGIFRISNAGNRTVQLATDLNVNVINTGGRAEINTVMTGTGTLIKSGNGILTLNGTHNLTSTIQIDGGILEAAGDNSLGSTQILIRNGATFRSYDSINNLIRTAAGATGTTGNAVIETGLGDVMTLTGTLNHLSQGRIDFGSTTGAGTIVASFTVIGENATTSGYRVAEGILEIGNSFVGTNLFLRPGNGLTEIDAGGTLNTRGFRVDISNLDMDGGTISTSTGVLEVRVQDTGVVTNSQTGTVVGTSGADYFGIEIAGSGSVGLASLTFNNWTSGTDTIVLSGGSGGNILGGSTRGDNIYGNDGNDTLFGNGGIDIIYGGNGDDSISLNANNSNSFVYGGADTDTLSVSGTITVAGLLQFEALNLVAGANLVLSSTHFQGFDFFSTLSGDGTITVNLALGSQSINARGMSVTGGSTIAFAVNGTTGVDLIKIALGASGTLNGNSGIDQLIGGDLIDIINGGADGDKIRGGGGGDFLSGGSGTDVFKYREITDAGIGLNQDTISDFVAGTDRLNFGRIDANASIAGDQAFAYVGTGAFSGGGVASIRWVDLGADLRVEVDVDGNGTADMHVLLQGAGAQTLTVADFVL